MSERLKWRITAVVAAAFVALVAVSCGGSTATPQIVKETVVVTQPPVVQTVVQTVEVPGAQSTVLVPQTVVVAASPTPTEASFYGLPIPTAGSGSGTAPTPKTDSSTVVIRTGLELRGSGMPSDQEGMFKAEEVTESPFMADKAGNSVPQIIDSWKLASDLSSVTMKLTPNIPFQGGFGNLSADDVVWSYNTGNPGTNSVSATDGGANWVSFLGSNEVQKIDDLTVKFNIDHFDVRWDTFLFGQGGLALSITSKKAYDEKGEDWVRDNVIGTGPFSVQSYSRDDKLVLNAVKPHHRATPNIDTLIYQAIPDDAVAVAALKTGDIDVLTGPIDLRGVPQLNKDGFITLSAGAGSFETISFTGNYWEKTQYDTGDPLPSNFGSSTYANAPWIGNPDDQQSMETSKKVRLALSMAIDRDLIAQVLTGGAGWAVYEYGVSPTNPNWQDKWTVPYDPVAAGKMLDDAGYPKKADGTRFAMPFFIRIGRGDEDVGTAVVGMWRDLGIDMQDWKAEYQTYRPGLIARSNTAPWVHSAGAEGPQQPWDWPVYGSSECSRGRGAYNIGFEAAKFCQFFDSMSAEPDVAKRNLIRNDMTDWLMEWNPAIGTIAVPNIALANPNKIASWDMPLAVREAQVHHPEFIVTK